MIMLCMPVVFRTIEPRILATPGRTTSGFDRPGTHCLHQARSAVRCSASRTKTGGGGGGGGEGSGWVTYIAASMRASRCGTVLSYGTMYSTVRFVVRYGMWFGKVYGKLRYDILVDTAYGTALYTSRAHSKNARGIISYKTPDQIRCNMLMCSTVITYQIICGLRGMLSPEPLPPGHRAPVAAVAAAAAAAKGDVGLRARAITAMWPALRALGRVPCLRDVGTDLSRVVYHEVFLSLQVR